jgi:adenosine deaminase
MRGNIDIMLHDHLDGSRPLLNILPELFWRTHEAKKCYPFNPHTDHFRQVKKWFSDVHRDIIEKFSLTTGVMQEVDTLYLAAKTYTEFRAREGYRYCEIRIAPQYHTFRGLTEKQVIDALIRGIKRGEEKYPGIEVNIVFSIGREVSSERSEELVLIASECDCDYVVGIDLVCDEAENPPEKHTEAFRLARVIGIKRTCHAGEWVTNRRPEEKETLKQLVHNFTIDSPLLAKNISTALNVLKADRISHATALIQDPFLLEEVKARGVGIEGCPASNLETKAIPYLVALGIPGILDKGILYSLNSDDDLFLPTLDEIISTCKDDLLLTASDFEKMRANAWRTRFGLRKPVPCDVEL